MELAVRHRTTRAAPVCFSNIFSAASRSVCDGPTVKTTSDIPSGPLHRPSPFYFGGFGTSEIASSVPDDSCLASLLLKGGLTYRLRPASPPMHHAEATERDQPAARQSLPPWRRRGRSLRLWDHDRRLQRGRSCSCRSAASATKWPRPGPLPRSARTSTTPSPRRVTPARPARRWKGSSWPRSRTHARAPTPPTTRCRRTSSAARISTTSPPTSACTRACPARRRRRCREAPVPRSSPTTAAGRAAAHSPPPGAGGVTRPQPGRSTARAERRDGRRIDRRPEREDRLTGYPANVMPANFGEKLTQEGTRRPRPVPAEGNRRRLVQGPAAAEPGGRSPAADII